jgi:hypothetical protein
LVICDSKFLHQQEKTDNCCKTWLNSRKCFFLQARIKFAKGHRRIPTFAVATDLNFEKTPRSSKEVYKLQFFVTLKKKEKNIVLVILRGAFFHLSRSLFQRFMFEKIERFFLRS